MVNAELAFQRPDMDMCVRFRPQALGKSPNSWVPDLPSAQALTHKTAEFRQFPRLACAVQNPLHAAGWSRRIQGVRKMTFNLGNLQQVALSVVGAVLAASLFISAAVGPAAQFI
jgi:hypothetical protein